MAYYGQRRRLGDVVFEGDSVSGLPALPTSAGFPNVLAIGEAGVQDLENLLHNAETGNLTANQVSQIKATGDSTIATAAAGNSDLTQYEQGLWHQELTDTINSGYYGGAGNLLADLGLDNSPGAPAGTSGILAWLENNFLLVFGVTAAFLIFRPDKAFK